MYSLGKIIATGDTHHVSGLEVNLFNNFTFSHNIYDYKISYIPMEFVTYN